jgi:hypothetical protein
MTVNMTGINKELNFDLFYKAPKNQKYLKIKLNLNFKKAPR